MKQRSVRKILAYSLYYGFATYLPRSHDYGLLGRFSSRFRRALCKILIGKSTSVFGIEKGASFGWGNQIIMKEHSNLGENFRLEGKGNVTIGKHVMMGPDVLIITQDHKILPEGFDDFIVRDVAIGDYAWIGARVIILKGVRLGKHTIIGAGSVVTRDIPDYGIAVGVPARVVRMRR